MSCARNKQEKLDKNSEGEESGLKLENWLGF